MLDDVRFEGPKPKKNKRNFIFSDKVSNERVWEDRYRSGYATKDARQTHILALKMKHENFRKLVEQAAVCRGKVPFTGEEKRRPVRVQWDPERVGYFWSSFSVILS